MPEPTIEPRGSLRFAWYGRLSTDELQQPQLAFPSQRAACERRVEGLGRIVCEFTDVESGRSHERAGVEALLAEVRCPDRRFDAVVTYKAERFARRMALALAYEEELRLAGVPIYVSDEAGEPGRPTSVLTRRIKQAVGEWYVLELVEESRRGMEENTRQGFNTGGIAPYGYGKRFLAHPAKVMADRGKRKAILEPEPDQALVVERIFREFVFGRQTIRGMAEQLNREGIPSARGGPWTGAAISGILDNPKYTGYQVWNRRRRKTAGNRANPDSEWIWSETLAHSPIVSLELWRAAQDLRRRPETDLAPPPEVRPGRPTLARTGLLPLQPPDGGGPPHSPNQGARLVLGMSGLQGPHSRRPTPGGSGWGPRAGATAPGALGGPRAPPTGPPSQVPEGEPAEPHEVRDAAGRDQSRAARPTQEHRYRDRPRPGQRGRRGAATRGAGDPRALAAA